MQSSKIDKLNISMSQGAQTKVWRGRKSENYGRKKNRGKKLT